MENAKDRSWGMHGSFRQPYKYLIVIIKPPCRARCPAHPAAGCPVLGEVWKVLWSRKRQRGWPRWAPWAGGGGAEQQERRHGGLGKAARVSCAALKPASSPVSWMRHSSTPRAQCFGIWCVLFYSRKNKPKFLIRGPTLAFFTMSFFTGWWILGRQVWFSDCLSLGHAQLFPRQAISISANL